MTSSNAPAHGRRRVLAAAGAALTAPFIWTSRARAAEQVIMRTPGGARDDVLREIVWEPFRRETGIEIVPVSANTSKLVAMTKMGQSEIDIIDNSTGAIKRLQLAGGLLPMPFKDFTHTNPDDISADLRGEYYVASSTYGSVLGYDTNVYPAGRGPRSWADFWDVTAFPGPRALGSMDANEGDLEMALLADGVPMDTLYPLDLDRAFRSLTRIRPSIAKFWESGAMSTQLLTDREVTMGSVWNNRLQLAADKGAPLAIQWNQCRVEVQAYGIMKFGKNLAGAAKFIDFASSATSQSNLLKRTAFIPSNIRAFPDIPKSLIDPDAGKPWTETKGFLLNDDWWVEHGKEAQEYWARWIIQ